MSITTKTGDQGATSLYSGERVPKSDFRMMTCGEIDELNSFMGWARVALEDVELTEMIQELQRTLFLIGSSVATVEEKQDTIQVLEDSHLNHIDGLCEDFESRITMPTDFILPGGCESAARLDICRSVARRAERSLTRLIEEGILARSTNSQWMNRLSDLFWLLARYCEGEKTTLRREQK